MPAANQGKDDGEPLGAFTIAAFCRRFGIGVTKVYAEIKAGRLRAVKVGNRTLILFVDAKEWANSLPTVQEA